MNTIGGTFVFDLDAIGSALFLPVDALTGERFWPLSEQDGTEPPSDTCPVCGGSGSRTYRTDWNPHTKAWMTKSVPCDCNATGYQEGVVR